MDVSTIFGLQFVLSIIVFTLIAKWYLVPWIAEKSIEQALMVLILPHAFRHMGLMFLVPGAVAEPLPSSFAIPAAFGDLASALLAILSLVALRGRWSLALPLVWLFNIIGMADLLYALPQTEVAPNFGATWYIPTFLVPLLLITHVMVFTQLLSGRRRGDQTSIERSGYLQT
jgi:hypothetical protein